MHLVWPWHMPSSTSSLGMAATGAAGIGVGIAQNFVAGSVIAGLDSSTADVDGSLQFTATAGPVVSALGLGVAGAAARGNGTTGALAGAGSAATNAVDDDVEAYIKNSIGPKSVTTPPRRSHIDCDRRDTDHRRRCGVCHRTCPEVAAGRRCRSLGGRRCICRAEPNRREPRLRRQGVHPQFHRDRRGRRLPQRDVYGDGNCTRDWWVGRRIE